MTSLPTDANESNETPQSREEKLESLGVALMAVKRLSQELGLDAESSEDLADFSDHSPPPDVGEMHTASDSPVVHQAKESLKAAFAEVGMVETIASVVETIAEKVGLVI